MTIFELKSYVSKVYIYEFIHKIYVATPVVLQILGTIIILNPMFALYEYNTTFGMFIVKKLHHCKKNCFVL